jgi:hypothetical protein
MLVAVTDHAAQRFRQRVRGTLEEKTEIASRVARAYAAGRVEQDSRGTVLVRDLERRDLGRSPTRIQRTVEAWAGCGLIAGSVACRRWSRMSKCGSGSQVGQDRPPVLALESRCRKRRTSRRAGSDAQP